MRNYKIRHSKRNIKKVFKRVFGNFKFVYPAHGISPCHFRKPSVGQMRFMLFCYWRIY